MSFPYWAKSKIGGVKSLKMNSLDYSIFWNILKWNDCKYQIISNLGDSRGELTLNLGEKAFN